MRDLENMTGTAYCMSFSVALSMCYWMSDIQDKRELSWQSEM